MKMDEIYFGLQTANTMLYITGTFSRWMHTGPQMNEHSALPHKLTQSLNVVIVLTENERPFGTKCAQRECVNTLLSPQHELYK